MMETKTYRKSRAKVINLSLNKKQYVDIFTMMNERDKMEIYDELKKILFLNRFEKLSNSLKNSELTMDEITAEVEAVRQERYETGRQIIG